MSSLQDTRVAQGTKEATAAIGAVNPLPAWPQGGTHEVAALQRVVESGRWGSNQGEVTAAFQDRFAEFQGVPHAIALTNGTLALVAALRACGVGVGDEVIVPPYTFIATASSVLFVGAIPVFADVDPLTHLLDPDAVEAAITDRTRAVIPVHLAGNVADMDAFTRIADTYNIVVIEDAAQAIGAQWRGRGVGSFGTIGTFSFQSSKNLTSGEGGMVTTSDEEMAHRLYSQINVGRTRGGGWYQHDTVGYNLRLTEFQSALLDAQLDHFPEQQQRRNENAEALRARLAECDRILMADPDPRVTAHGQHLFIFRVPGLAHDHGRDRAVAALQQAGLQASAGYVPLHRNEALRRETDDLARRIGREPRTAADCPNTDLVASDTIWLPHSVLLGSPEQVDAVADAIIAVIEALTES